MRNSKIREKVLVLTTTVALTMVMGITAFAGQWNNDSAGWQYQEDNGNRLNNGWNWIDGKCYYFTPDGYCLINTITPDGYTVDANGAWTVNGIVQIQMGEASENYQTWICGLGYYDGPKDTAPYFGVQIDDSEDYVSDIYQLYDPTGTVPYTIENKPEWINYWDVQIVGEIFDSTDGPGIKVHQLTVIQ